jgi:hypothetical protein
MPVPTPRGDAAWLRRRFLLIDAVAVIEAGGDDGEIAGHRAQLLPS